jgi:hypothetical protein
LLAVNGRTKAQEAAARNLAGVKETARTRGELYLEYAKGYLARQEFRNADMSAAEGLCLSVGPFYLAVRDQLEDIRVAIPRLRQEHLSPA